jgi:hypothetical protein
MSDYDFWAICYIFTDITKQTTVKPRNEGTFWKLNLKQSGFILRRLCGQGADWSRWLSACSTQFGNREEHRHLKKCSHNNFTASLPSPLHPPFVSTTTIQFFVACRALLNSTNVLSERKSQNNSRPNFIRIRKLGVSAGETGAACEHAHWRRLHSQKRNRTCDVCFLRENSGHEGDR